MRAIVMMLLCAMMVSACASSAGHVQVSQWESMDYAASGYGGAENLSISPGMGMR
jgi:hypothetical protein